MPLEKSVDVVSLLNVIESIEKIVAQFYLNCHDFFFNKGEQDASTFFYRMHIEEKKHAYIAAYCKKLAKQNPKSFLNVKADLDGLKKMESEISKFTTTELTTLSDALADAIQIEVAIGEQYIRFIAADDNEHMKNLISVLSDKDHSESISVFAKESGLLM